MSGALSSRSKLAPADSKYYSVVRFMLTFGGKLFLTVFVA
jgi:hypothetical protein